MALRNEMLILPVEEESQSEGFDYIEPKGIGNRVRERRVLEPAISTHDHNVFNDFSRT